MDYANEIELLLLLSRCEFAMMKAEAMINAFTYDESEYVRIPRRITKDIADELHLLKTQIHIKRMDILIADNAFQKQNGE